MRHTVYLALLITACSSNEPGPRPEPVVDSDDGTDTDVTEPTPPTDDTDPPTTPVEDKDGFFTDESAKYDFSHVAYGRGVAITEINGDGRPDLLLGDGDDDHRGTSENSRFYIGTGNGDFEVVAAVDLGFSDEDLRINWGSSWADFDNDGDQDVLLVSGAYSGFGELSLYQNRMDTEGRFVEVSDRLHWDGPVEPSKWWAGSWADLNGDTFLDFVVGNVDRIPAVFLNDREGGFVQVTKKYAQVFRRGIDGKNPTFIDFDGDGDLDLLMGGKTNYGLYEIDGDDFIDRTSLIPTPEEEVPYVFGVVVEDFDQDGLDDIYMGRWDRQDMVWFNRGGTFERHDRDIGIDDTVTIDPPFEHVQGTAFENTMGLQTIDIGEDGWPDVWAGGGDRIQAVKQIIFCNQGGIFHRCTDDVFNGLVRFTRNHGMAGGDVDMDGDVDLVFAYGGAPQTDHAGTIDSREAGQFMRRTKAEGHRTALLTLEGREGYANRDAIGAKVRVIVEGQRTVYLSVRSTQGFGNSNGRVLVVPLGQADFADLEITWPGGRHSNGKISSGQRLHIIQPNPGM